MNKIKEFLSINKYNTPSKLLYYFLDTYGKNRLHRRDSINTCELVKMIFWSSLEFIAAWSFLFLIGAMISLWLISNLIFLHFGWDALKSIEALGIAFMIGWCFPIGTAAAIVIVTLTDKYSEHKRQIALEPESKPKTLFGTWMESVKNKVCIQIDLKDFR